MKARYIKGATLFNPRLRFTSVKNRATFQCDSRWESDFLIDLEFDSSVKRYATQPTSFTYDFKGKQRRYTSDVVLMRQNGKVEHIEVKDAAYADSPELRDKIAYLSDLFGKYQNSSLTVVTSKDIHRDPGHVTRKILYKYMDISVSDALKRMAIRALYKADMPIHALETRFIQRGVDRVSAWAFLAQHYNNIIFVGNPSISSNTIICWSK
ncbi:MAG: hypothetical protein HWD84_11120 [Flavobacteriaceae bacterium]|nr:hypothetical protein [Flavobacteriaceae bacterium]